MQINLPPNRPFPTLTLTPIMIMILTPPLSVTRTQGDDRLLKLFCEESNFKVNAHEPA